jgi:capsid protein
MRAGLQSLSEKIRERGYDPDEVFAEIEKERTFLAGKKIVVDSNALVPEKGGTVAQPGADGGTVPAETPAAREERDLIVGLARSLVK